MRNSLLPTVTQLAWWKLRGRLNSFYRLEALATSMSSKNRVFLRFEDKVYTIFPEVLLRIVCRDQGLASCLLTRLWQPTLGRMCSPI